MKITAALMLKVPRPGLVKTRLAVHVGAEKAAEIYVALVEHQLRNIPSEWACAIHYAPADAEVEMRVWLEKHLPAGTPFRPQVEGDLGMRMAEAVRREFLEGAEAVFLLGGDCPELTVDVLREVGRRLSGVDAVIGSAMDGGYVYLGVRRRIPELFMDIPWSTERVLELTLERAAALGLKIACHGRFRDVDEVSDLGMCGGSEALWMKL